MNPSAAAIAWIRAQSPNWAGQSDAQIAASLNATMVANPVAQAPQVPNAISESALMGTLSQASQTALLNWVNLALVKADVEDQNRVGLLLWAAKLQLAGVITADDATALTTYLNGTVPDPTWTANVPAPLVGMGRLVDANDVEAARNA
jgi:hypothetical protein